MIHSAAALNICISFSEHFPILVPTSVLVSKEARKHPLRVTQHRGGMIFVNPLNETDLCDV